MVSLVSFVRSYSDRGKGFSRRFVNNFEVFLGEIEIVFIFDQRVKL